MSRPEPDSKPTNPASPADAAEAEDAEVSQGAGALPNLNALLSLGSPSTGPLDGLEGGAGMTPDGSGHSPVFDRSLGELRNIDVDEVVPNEYQPRRRFEEESLAALTASVKELGVLQPILVRPDGLDRYELIAGERRWRAARRAGLVTIPAIVRLTDDVGSLEQSIVENLHRQDLNVLEEAVAYQQLVEDFGMTQDEVATRVGKSRSAIGNTLRLLNLPASVQRVVRSGELSAGHARAVLSLSDGAAQADLAHRIVAESMSVRQAETAAKALDSGATDQKPDGGRERGTSAKSASALEVERVLEDRLATRVEVVESPGTGRIVIRYADDEDLDRIFRLLG